MPAPLTEYHEHWQQQRRAHAHLARGASAYPGCAALVALLAGRTLLLANAGDCRGVLCRARRGLAGSRDHTALLPDERERLAAAGAAVAWQHGSWRVGASGLQVRVGGGVEPWAGRVLSLLRVAW